MSLQSSTPGFRGLLTSVRRGGIAPTPPSWNPFTALPPGVNELPPTLIPDGSLPPPPPPKKWAGAFELGLNGSQGNAKVF